MVWCLPVREREWTTIFWQSSIVNWWNFETTFRRYTDQRGKIEFHLSVSYTPNNHHPTKKLIKLISTAEQAYKAVIRWTFQFRLSAGWYMYLVCRKAYLIDNCLKSFSSSFILGCYTPVVTDWTFSSLFSRCWSVRISSSCSFWTRLYRLTKAWLVWLLKFQWFLTYQSYF